MKRVLDASAMLALLRDEEGGEQIQGFLDEAVESGAPVYAHVVNAIELFYDFSRSGDVLQARAAIADLQESGLQLCADLDTAFWEDAAQLKADWRRVSLADCCGLALARRLDAQFVTSDHHEMDVLDAAGLCDFLFFR